MAMTFKPKPAAQIEAEERERMAENLFPKGEYDFEIVDAVNAAGGPTSKHPGMAYIKIKAAVYLDDGSFRVIFGILHPEMEAQLRHFCEIGNLMDKYEAGTLTPHDCMDVKGRLKLKIKSANGDYPAKNEIVDFIPLRKQEAVAGAAPVAEAPSDDDVPF